MSIFLRQFTQPCSADFALELADNSAFICQQVVRIVPHKRLVCRGVWQGQVVYAKLFLGPNAAKYAARDSTGLALLVEAKINTPQLLYQGEAADKSAQVLIYLAIEPADTAEAVWPNLNQEARFDLAKKLVAEVAKHHHAGLLQTDLYLKNFLVADDLVYTLDGDGMRHFNPLKDNHALQNLSVLWSKCDVLNIEKWQQGLVEIYSDARAWNAVVEPDKLATMANLQRLKAASNYADKKVFRNCTDVQVSALGSLFHATCRDANINIPTNTTELDALMQRHHLLKNGNTCTVALAEINNKKVVIKRYNIKSFWHGISRAFRQTRAATSWANAHRLKLLNIATAKPIALIEARTFGLRGRAYFLAEYIDAPDVAEYFANSHNKTERAETVKNIVTLFYKLYLLKLSHGDMKASNIKVVDNKPVLIDLDSMRQHNTHFTADAAHVRDLKRFMQNWQNDNALYNAFVKTFKVVYTDDSLLIKAGIVTNKE